MNLRALAAFLTSLCLLVLVTCGEEVPLGSGHEGADGGYDGTTDQIVGGTKIPERDSAPDQD